VRRFREGLAKRVSWRCLLWVDAQAVGQSITTQVGTMEKMWRPQVAESSVAPGARGCPVVRCATLRLRLAMGTGRRAERRT